MCGGNCIYRHISLIPTIVTLNVTGVVYTPVNEDYSDGRKVIVKYRNATQEVGVDRFVAMVLAKALYEQ